MGSEMKAFLYSRKRCRNSNILASSPEVEGITGEYFDKKKVKTPSKEARDTGVN